MKITQCNGEGQGECRRCADSGKWNRMWMPFLYRIEGREGCYCEKCVREIEIEDVLVTLEKLYNDFTMRKEEEQALDFAINFIKADCKRTECKSCPMYDTEKHYCPKWCEVILNAIEDAKLEKMITDCERHLNCKGCPHEGECE